MTEVIMPKMGDGMEEGTLVEWLKKEGDTVKSGEVIGNIQTDKATLELEAPGSGVLTGLLIKGGDTVPVGRPIAAILKSGEKLPAGWGGADYKGGSSPAPAATEIPAVAAVVTPVDMPVAESSNGDRVVASPLARKIAAERNIDLRTVKGTGPGGRIVERDLVTATSAPAAAPATPASAPVQIFASAEDRTIPLSRLKQITGNRTLQSKTQVPHFYVTVEVDLEKILALRAQFEEEGASKPSINDFVIKATALALREMPEANATVVDKNLLLYSAVNIGIAVAVEDGLTVPVLKNADQLGLKAISSKSKDLAKRARDNKLSLDELSGSTFSISNMGMLDVDNFVAIVNQPNAGILAIASARKKVVANADDEIEIRTRMNITGSFDHRVLDGALGAKFVNLVKALLENPTRMLG
jgi:pyruvate dehydrogenase E2 component (dihydrolipoamide acetyltransferase)